MNDDSSEEKRPTKKARGRKRGKRIDNSDSEDSDIKKNSSIKKAKYSKDELDSEEEIKISPPKDKQLELQKKLKFIVNEVREKGKYEYNKQEIPENLKYHSDESDSSLSKTNNSKNIKDKSNNKNIGNTNSNKIESVDKKNEPQSIKTKKSKNSKDGSIISSISSKRRIKKFSNDNKNDNLISEFNLDNNTKNKESK